MQIVISKQHSFDNNFIPYLLNYTKQLLNDTIDLKQLKDFTSEFGFDFEEAVTYSISNLKVYETPSDYTIKFSETAKYKENTCGGIINKLTYGNRSVKGYVIIEKIFNYVVNDINRLYKEWLDGN